MFQLRISRSVHVFDSNGGDSGGDGGGEGGDGGKMIVAEVWAASSRVLVRCQNSGGSAFEVESRWRKKYERG